MGETPHMDVCKMCSLQTCTTTNFGNKCNKHTTRIHETRKSGLYTRNKQTYTWNLAPIQTHKQMSKINRTNTITFTYDRNKNGTLKIPKYCTDHSYVLYKWPAKELQEHGTSWYRWWDTFQRYCCINWWQRVKRTSLLRAHFGLKGQSFSNRLKRLQQKPEIKVGFKIHALLILFLILVLLCQ